MGQNLASSGQGGDPVGVAETDWLVLLRAAAARRDLLFGLDSEQGQKNNLSDGTLCFWLVLGSILDAFGRG